MRDASMDSRGRETSISICTFDRSSACTAHKTQPIPIHERRIRFVNAPCGSPPSPSPGLHPWGMDNGPGLAATVREQTPTSRKQPAPLTSIDTREKGANQRPPSRQKTSIQSCTTLLAAGFNGTVPLAAAAKPGTGTIRTVAKKVGFTAQHHLPEQVVSFVSSDSRWMGADVSQIFLLCFAACTNNASW